MRSKATQTQATHLNKRLSDAAKPHSVDGRVSESVQIVNPTGTIAALISTSYILTNHVG